MDFHLTNKHPIDFCLVYIYNIRCLLVLISDKTFAFFLLFCSCFGPQVSVLHLRQQTKTHPQLMRESLATFVCAFF